MTLNSKVNVGANVSEVEQGTFLKAGGSETEDFL